MSVHTYIKKKRISKRPARPINRFTQQDGLAQMFDFSPDSDTHLPRVKKAGRRDVYKSPSNAIVARMQERRWAIMFDLVRSVYHSGLQRRWLSASDIR